MDEKIKNIVKHVPDHKIFEHIRELSNIFTLLARDIEFRVSPSNASVTYKNLATRTATELNRLANFYPSDIEGIAWCARNIFEINLVLRYVSQGSENLDKWMGQFAGDEKQIIEGFLALSKDLNPLERKILQDRLDTIDTIVKKHNIKVSGPFNIKSIADQELLSDEYTGLYKLFSKYVHPSSWLTNSSTESVNSKECMNIFVIYAQIHAGDSCSRLDAWLADNAST